MKELGIVKRSLFCKQAPQKTFDDLPPGDFLKFGLKDAKFLGRPGPDGRAKRGLNRAKATKVPTRRSTVGMALEGAQQGSKRRILS